MSSQEDLEDDNELEDISPHVRIRIDPRKKRDWLHYADEHDVSLTDLIKDAVDNTIGDTWVLAKERDTDSTPPTSLDVDLRGVEDGVNQILDRLGAVESQLDGVTLAEAVDDMEQLTRQELISIANQCHDQLPQVPDGDTLIEITQNVVTGDQAERPKLTGTADDIAAALGEDEHRVRQALIFLETEQVGNVASIIHNGIRRWYEANPTMDLNESVGNIQTAYDLEFQSGADFDGAGN